MTGEPIAPPVAVQALTVNVPVMPFCVGLLGLMAYAGPARYSVDYYLEQKILGGR